MMREESQEADQANRIVLELRSENGAVSGALITAEGNRSFWGWLELMSALELAADDSPANPPSEGTRTPG
jgi:hypothetical protein